MLSLTKPLQFVQSFPAAISINFLLFPQDRSEIYPLRDTLPDAPSGTHFFLCTSQQHLGYIF